MNALNEPGAAGLRASRVCLAACIAAVGLSACSGEREQRRASAGLCADFGAQKTTPSLGVSDGAASVDDCVKRWAYSLAPSRDGADEVADAVVGACSTQLSRWNQQSLNQPAAADGGEATSIITGQPTTPIAEHLSFTRNRALLYVVQARAGKCAAPKAVNGVPEGLG